MENPATWTEVEYVIKEQIADYNREREGMRKHGGCGTMLSLERRITDSLLRARLLSLNATQEIATKEIRMVIDQHNDEAIGLSLTMKISNALRAQGQLR